MSEEHRDLEYDAVYVGEYGNNWISGDPTGYYDLYIFVNEEQKFVILAYINGVNFHK